MEPIAMLVYMILGGSLNLIFKNHNSSFMLARVFFLASCFLVLNNAILYFSVIAEQPVSIVLTYVDKYSALIWRILLGYLVVFISGDDFIGLYTAEHPDKKHVFLNTLSGLSISIGGTFLIATINNLYNFKSMSHFFSSSGYTVGLLWPVLIVETAAGFGILLHQRFKTGLPAAGCLLLITIGSIYTHWHNYDPFSDSFAAVGQLFNLLIVSFLYYKETQFKQMKYPLHTLPA